MRQLRTRDKISERRQQNADSCLLLDDILYYIIYIIRIQILADEGPPSP